jgi:hypothetical protein
MQNTLFKGFGMRPLWKYGNEDLSIVAREEKTFGEFVRNVFLKKM